MSTKEELLAQLKTLVDQTTDQGAQVAIKREIDDLFPDVSTAVDTTNQRELTDALSKLKLTQSMKLPKFQKGDNFARYCQRFEEFISIAKITDANLYMYFLQNVNDETYSILKTVELSTAQKAEATEFCPLYKTAIYGDVSISLKNEVMECKQRNDEAISDFVYRLREKASIAYTDPAMVEENCFIAFLRGVKDPQLKRKLNEATSLTNFKDAVKLAKRLEKINEMLAEETEVSSILKESTYTFRPARDRSQSPHSQQTYPNYRGRSTYPDPNRDNRSRNNYRSTSRDRRDRSNERSRPNDRSDSQNRDRAKSPNNYRRDRSSSPYNNYHRRDRSRTPDRNNSRFYNNERYASNVRRDVICWNCDRSGHVSRFCWKNNGQNQRDMPQNFRQQRQNYDGHNSNDFQRNLGGINYNSRPNSRPETPEINHLSDDPQNNNVLADLD